jgi:hypothetical protein
MTRVNWRCQEGKHANFGVLPGNIAGTVDVARSPDPSSAMFGPLLLGGNTDDTLNRLNTMSVNKDTISVNKELSLH